VLDYDAVTGKRSENRRVEPLGLVRLADGWLLVAHCLSREEHVLVMRQF
jgi:predicted DNA-binding transcriptional regulator YafY